MNSRTSTSALSYRLLIMSAFFFSGAAGLIYQAVWLRMLMRILGSTVQASALVLSVFMAGLAIGGALGGVLADRQRSLLSRYIVLELMIAAAAWLSSVVLISALGTSYPELLQRFGSEPYTLMSIRFCVSAACLLLPSILIGATLPLMAALVTRMGHNRFEIGLSRLYAVNTAGAVIGVAAAGFFLIGAVGERWTLATGVILNGAAAAAVGVLALQARRCDQADAEPRPSSAVSIPHMPSPLPAGQRRLAMGVFFFSGFTALAYEILWTRLLPLYLETSMYAFSFMLATFLAGIAGGGWLAGRVKAPWHQPMMSFGVMEIAVGVAAIVGFFLFPGFDSAADSGAAWAVRILSGLVTVLPAAVIFGWMFPVAVRCCASESSGPGKLTGAAYSINAAGTILGAAVTGFLLLPLLGLRGAFFLIAGLNVACGVAILFGCGRRPNTLPAVASLAAASMCVAMIVVFPQDPYRIVMENKIARELGANSRIAAYRESAEATTVLAFGYHPDRGEYPVLYINGIGVASFVTETKMLAHLPIVLAHEPRRFLVICFGVGTTLRSASRHEGLEVVAVDLVPDVFDYFPLSHADADIVTAKPEVSFVTADGRNYLLTHPEPFDVITLDPSPPLHAAGMVNLYTREFFELCRSRLSPGGVCCLWVPPESKSQVAMVLKTFIDVFPGASLWGGIEYPGFYIIGGFAPVVMTRESLDSVVARLAEIEDLGEWSSAYTKVEKLRQLYLMPPDELETALSPVRVLTDDWPAVEFPLWRYLRDPQGWQTFSAKDVRQARGKMSVVPAVP